MAKVAMILVVALISVLAIASPAHGQDDDESQDNSEEEADDDEEEEEEEEEEPSTDEACFTAAGWYAAHVMNRHDFDATYKDFLNNLRDSTRESDEELLDFLPESYKFSALLDFPCIKNTLISTMAGNQHQLMMRNPIVATILLVTGLLVVLLLALNLAAAGRERKLRAELDKLVSQVNSIGTRVALSTEFTSPVKKTGR